MKSNLYIYKATIFLLIIISKKVITNIKIFVIEYNIIIKNNIKL